MKNVNLNNRVFESHTEIMDTVAEALEKECKVLSSRYNGESITVHYLSDDDDDEDGETIEWYCHEVNYNQDEEGSVSSVDIDC